MIEFSSALEGGDDGGGSQIPTGLTTPTGRDIAQAVALAVSHLEQIDLARRDAQPKPPEVAGRVIDVAID
jgi:hypothetical protein